MTKRECAIVMAYTGVVMLTGDSIGEYYKYISEIMGRPVYTHELADRNIQKQLKEASRADFIGLCKGATA